MKEATIITIAMVIVFIASIGHGFTDARLIVTAILFATWAILSALERIESALSGVKND